MKVTFHTGIMYDGQIFESVSQDIDIPDHFSPIQIEEQLESWARCRTFMSYEAEAKSPVMPRESNTDETHAIH